MIHFITKGMMEGQREMMPEATAQWPHNENLARMLKTKEKEQLWGT